MLWDWASTQIVKQMKVGRSNSFMIKSDFIEPETSSPFGQATEVSEYTDDVFGKELDEFRPAGDDTDQTPLIYRVLAGALIGKEENLKELGIFRVTGSDPKIRELEVHLS